MPRVIIETALRYRVSIVVCARWETLDITEWLTYNSSIGFDHVYLYCNDDDPTELYMEVLPFLSGPSPFVTFVHFPYQGQQRRMYLHFLKTELYRSDWVTFIDVDEFLYLPRDSNINTYLARVGDIADVIYFNWLMFGNNGHSERPKGSVLNNFVRHEDALHPYTKVLVRTSTVNPELIAQNSGHFWHDWPNVEGNLRRLNVLGESVDGYYDEFPHRAAAQIRQPGMLGKFLEEGVICHFCMKSEADFERRVERGVAGEFSAQTSWGEHKRLGQHKAILDSINAVEFHALRDYWRHYGSAGMVPSVAPAWGSISLAYGKAATQSSVSAWSLNPAADADAAGAVSGKFTGSFQFHTAEEDEPWWQVDLGCVQVIKEVWIYNRLDAGQQRARHFMISTSDDGRVWTQVFRKMDGSDFGGIDGFPFRWLSKGLATCRYVRISLTGRGYLHLDQVEVFGTLAGPQAKPSSPWLPAPKGCNLALRRSASQSSISEWSIGASIAEDAAGAVDGVRDKDYGFCTAEEHDPWWQCDLGGVFTIGTIIVFNRRGGEHIRKRATPLIIETSITGQDYAVLYATTDGYDFGDAHGVMEPLRVHVPDGIAARFVRLRVRCGMTFLHLAQVEVYESA